MTAMNLVKLCNETMMSEDRPEHVLLIPDSLADLSHLSAILNDFEIKTRVTTWRVKFTHIEGSDLWWCSTKTGSTQVICNAVRRALGHENFLMLDIVQIPHLLGAFK